ncbi:MAG: type II secretion system minor pseudopilin GspK [Gammaproteobacteria bacterium]|nr:type II secretion system minor pseudopilin GspK [Gammaproteobacteria bacterium]
MVSSSLRRQRGLALLMAMLIVVIGTTVAVSIVHEEKFTIRKTAHIHLMDRAALYAIGLEDWARIYLKEDREESETDSLDEYWATGIPGLPIEGGYLTGYVEDEQARFNLNTLVVSEIALNRFRRLCDNLDVDDTFIPALMDWIDEDFDIRYPDGMEENYEDYRVANREMADISELLLVHNVKPEIYDKLKPHITALPGTSTINVNTMSEVILQSLAPDVDVSDLVKQRDDDVFESVADFIERMQIPVDVEGLSVDTRFFRTHGQVVQGDQLYNMSSLIYRDADGQTRVINRTLGLF